MLGVLFDVTEEQDAKDVREMMLREMNHRVKNMFSIISGMVRIAGRSTDSVEDLVDGIQTRVNALARSHDLTQRRPGSRSLTLEDTVRASLEPYAGQAGYRVEGPAVAVEDQDLTALSLLLHEWATNAAQIWRARTGPGAARSALGTKKRQRGCPYMERNPHRRG